MLGAAVDLGAGAERLRLWRRVSWTPGAEGAPRARGVWWVVLVVGMMRRDWVKWSVCWQIEEWVLEEMYHLGCLMRLAAQLLCLRESVVRLLVWISSMRRLSLRLVMAM